MKDLDRRPANLLPHSPSSFSHDSAVQLDTIPVQGVTIQRITLDNLDDILASLKGMTILPAVFDTQTQ